MDLVVVVPVVVAVAPVIIEMGRPQAPQFRDRAVARHNQVRLAGVVEAAAAQAVVVQMRPVAVTLLESPLVEVTVDRVRGLILPDPTSSEQVVEAEVDKARLLMVDQVAAVMVEMERMVTMVL